MIFSSPMIEPSYSSSPALYTPSGTASFLPGNHILYRRALSESASASFMTETACCDRKVRSVRSRQPDFVAKAGRQRRVGPNLPNLPTLHGTTGDLEYNELYLIRSLNSPPPTSSCTGSPVFLVAQSVERSKPSILPCQTSSRSALPYFSTCIHTSSICLRRLTVCHKRRWSYEI